MHRSIFSTKVILNYLFIVCGITHLIETHSEHTASDLRTTFLYTGIQSKYYVSNKPVDAITAEETCKSVNKTFKLLSIETEEEYKELLIWLQATIGVDGFWTSGMETVYKSGRGFIWSSTAAPIEYSEFAPTLGQVLTGVHSRHPRGVHGYYPGDYSCACDKCFERPSCENYNCTITGEECDLDQPSCSEPLHQDCYLVDPEPTCTVTCPQCTLKRGNCTIIQPICKVKEGTPSCTTTRRGRCAVIPAKYEVRPGKCKLIQEPCVVTQSPIPCNRPFNCSYQYRPDASPECGNAPSFGRERLRGQRSVEYYLPRNCTTPCPPKPEPCPNPCPNEKCFTIFNCVSDLICQAPPVICPPAIHHCLPAELVKISEEILDCSDPETICEPAILECTEVQKKCEEDVINCPAPKTVCTPAVSHCPKADFTCSKPVVECKEPTVVCPTLPKCQIPISCYGTEAYPQDDCKCRGKRESFEKGELVSAKCVALKKDFNFKWAVEECSTKNYFICEESLQLNDLI